MAKQNPLPKATVILVCDECGEKIDEVSFSVSHLASVLSRLRKEHARRYHGWSETA